MFSDLDMQDKVSQTVGFLRKKSAVRPDVLLILGSGLTKLADEFKAEAVIPYEEIPNFKKTTVRTHKGRLIFTRLAGHNLMVMQGRFHVYEGYSGAEVAFPVMAAAALGAKVLITTNLCGGINRKLKIGDFMLIRDQLNLSGINPLCGLPVSAKQSIFVDMSNAYSLRLAKLMQSAAKKAKLKLTPGVLAYLTGPSFETPAELRMLENLKADCIGWSLVPEVIMARFYAMEVVGLSCISDYAHHDNPLAVDTAGIFNVGLNRAQPLGLLLEKFLSGLK